MQSLLSYVFRHLKSNEFCNASSSLSSTKEEVSLIHEASTDHLQRRQEACEDH